MDVTHGPITSFSPPDKDSDETRWRVGIGDGRSDTHIGWIDERGFYLKPGLDSQVFLSPAQLRGIIDQIHIKECGS